jgi:hypothetical protein
VTNVEREIAEVLNRHCMENNSNTPDWILATYLLACLRAFNEASQQREKWYGRGELANIISRGTS